MKSERKKKKDENGGLHITALPSYLEGKSNINKTENLQQNQSQFFCQVQKQQSINLQAFPRCVPEIARFLESWVKIKFGVSLVPATQEFCESSSANKFVHDEHACAHTHTQSVQGLLQTVCMQACTLNH